MNEPFNRWWIRLLALVMAIVFWFFVSWEKREQQSERIVETSVTYNTPSGVIILDPVQRVNVRLKGGARTVRALNPFMVDVVVDIPSDRKDTVEVHLGPEDVIHPDGLEVVSIEPNVLRFRLDREVTRLLPVDVRLVGEPAAGAIVEAVEVIPPEVLVSGPESVLEKIHTLTTRPISLDGHALTFEESTTILPPDPLVRIIRPSIVNVQIQMREPRHSGGSSRRQDDDPSR